MYLSSNFTLKIFNKKYHLDSYYIVIEAFRLASAIALFKHNLIGENEFLAAYNQFELDFELLEFKSYCNPFCFCRVADYKPLFVDYKIPKTISNPLYSYTLKPHYGYYFPAFVYSNSLSIESNRIALKSNSHRFPVSKIHSLAKSSFIQREFDFYLFTKDKYDSFVTYFYNLLHSDFFWNNPSILAREYFDIDNYRSLNTLIDTFLFMGERGFALNQNCSFALANSISKKMLYSSHIHFVDNYISKALYLFYFSNLDRNVILAVEIPVFEHSAFEPSTLSSKFLNFKLPGIYGLFEPEYWIEVPWGFWHHKGYFGRESIYDYKNLVNLHNYDDPYYEFFTKFDAIALSKY